MTARELAALLKMPAEGPGDPVLTSAAALEDAEAHDLSFAGAPTFFAAAQASRAGCLIVPPDYPAGPGCVIRAAQPRAAFAQALTFLYPAPPFTPGIDPSASVAAGSADPAVVQIGPHVTVGAGCRIGQGTRIGPGSALGDGVTLGENCVLHANVTLYPGVRIGNRAILHAGSVIGADGFGFALHQGRYVKFPQVGRVEIGDDVEIGANCCIDRAALGVTHIGEGTKLDNQVHIAHNCRIGKHVVIAAQTGLSGGVTVGDYAVIGGQVGVGDKARIESRAVIGSGSGILTSKIVRAGEPVWGTPARPLRLYLKQLASLARFAKGK